MLIWSLEIATSQAGSPSREVSIIEGSGHLYREPLKTLPRSYEYNEKQLPSQNVGRFLYRFPVPTFWCSPMPAMRMNAEQMTPLSFGSVTVTESKQTGLQSSFLYCLYTKGVLSLLKLDLTRDLILLTTCLTCWSRFFLSLMLAS